MKGAPEGNTNALKQGPGVQVNFYLGSVESSAIRRVLTRLYDREPTKQEIRAYARDKAKNGILAAIKDELPAIIL